MALIYQTGIFIYHLLIRFASIFNAKAKLWVNGRQNLFNTISQKINPADKHVWFHAASLGEFEQGRPVIEAFRKKNPGYKIVLTFYSPSGYEIRKNYNGADYIFYLPADSPTNARKFIELVNPVAVFFIKYEFWYNYLKILKNKNYPVFIFSAIFRKNQIFFKWYGGWFLKILKMFNHIFVQNAESEILLRNYGFNNMTVAGDTRFDRVLEIAAQAKDIATAQRFAQNNNILIAGSTWQPDEEIIAEFANKNAHSLKYIIAPHEIHKTNIDRLTGLFKVPVIRYSEIKDQNLEQYKVLIIDNIGMLSSLYKYGNIAYIGGGFGVGIHNILEAATFGMPVVFGPKYQKFQEAVNLLDKGGAFTISGAKQFETLLNHLLQNPETIKKSAEISKNFIYENKGATNTILNKISATVQF